MIPEHQRLVEDHIDYARKQARHVAWGLPDAYRPGHGGPLDMDDIMQIGFLGLIQAAETFDPTKGAIFKTWVNRQVEWAIFTEVERVARERRRGLGENGGRLVVLSSDRPVKTAGDEYLSLADTIAASEGDHDAWMDLTGALARLPVRDREILLYRAQGQTERELGLIYGVSPTRINQIARDARERLRLDLAGELKSQPEPKPPRILKGPLRRRRHGTISEYSNHRCRCLPCRVAWSEYCRERYHRRKENASVA